MTDRQIALDIILHIEKSGAYSNIAINKQLEKTKADSQGFVRELVYGVISNKIYLDYVINQFIKTDIKKVKAVSLNILRMGIYQIKFMNSVPEYAAINESVKLARKNAHGQDRFINAILRNYQKNAELVTLPDREKDLTAYLSIKYSYHSSIISLWLLQIGEEQIEWLLEANAKTPPLTIRVNKSKIKRTELINLLATHGFSAIKGENSKSCIKIKQTLGKNITDLDSFKKGLFTIQDESSMVAIDMLDPMPGDTVIDLCAAPGGKTVYMAEKMENKGSIIATDIHEHKLTLLSENALRSGVTIIHTKVQDASILDESLIGIADKVLGDAPCSGLGVVRRRLEIKGKDYQVFGTLPSLQLKILQAGAKYVKAGGILMYSTCTISRAENQDIIEEFLKIEKDFSIEEDMPISLFPHIHGTDGFFICKFTRKYLT